METETVEATADSLLDDLIAKPTTKDIQAHLSRVDEKAQTQIQSTLTKNWPEFLLRWRTGSSLYHQYLLIQNQLVHIESKLDDPQDGLIPSLSCALKERQDLATQYSESFQKLKIIQSLSTAYQGLMALSKLVYENQLVAAVSKIPETQSALQPLYPYQYASSLAKRAIYRSQELEEDLKQRLIDDIRSCFTCQDGTTKTAHSKFVFKSAVNARAPSQQTDSLILWSSAVDALETLCGQDCAAAQLKKIATLMIEKIINPLIESCSNHSSPLVLVPDEDSDHSSCVLNFEQQVESNRVYPYNSLRLLLSTLEEKLLTSKALKEKFYLDLISSLETKLLSQVLDSELPNSTRDQPRLSQLPNLISETRLFANWLEDHGWLLDSKENSLIDWCDKVQDRFLHKVATRVLELARREMLGTKWESLVVPWEIIPEVVELSSQNQKGHKDSVPHPPSSSKPSPLTSQPVTESLKQSVRFKSLFQFVSGTTNQAHVPDPATSNQPSQNPSSPGKFESLFDFGPTESRIIADSNESLDESKSPPIEQKTLPSSGDAISSASQPSQSNITTHQVSASHSTGPRSPVDVDNRAEEDVDWDMGGELEESETFLPNSSAHSRNLSDVAIVDEEIEEDAWGFDGSNEGPPRTDAPIGSGSLKTGGKQATNSTDADPSSSGSQQAAKDHPMEDEEPDPDAWGFEEEEPQPTLTDDDDDVMRLRGGALSSPAVSEVEDDDGWGWAEEVPVESSQSAPPIDKLAQSSGKKNDHVIDSAHQPATRVENLTISTLAQTILNIVKELVDDAIQTESPEFPSGCLSRPGPGLVQLGFDVIDLFRIIMFVHHSKLLDSVPSLCVQFSNDCDWLSHQLGLIPTLKTGYLEQVNKSCHQLTLLAKKVRANQMANQKAALMECLNEAEGFVHTSHEERFLACQRACKQVTHTLETLAHIWKPVMLSSEYLESMGELVEAVLGRILAEIEDQADIEENESKELNRICRSLHVLIDLFALQPGFERADIARYVPSWFKFCFLSEVLEASMADIMWMYQEGLLAEFTKLEIVALIRALFAESQLRAKNIDLILM